jgi:predicted transcriptional regulator
MPAITVKDVYSLRRAVFELCDLRGYTQTQAAQCLGITQPRVSQILHEGRLDFKERVDKRFSDPKLALVKKLEQYEVLRREAFLAWERSKSDIECTTEEKQLRTVYRTVVDPDFEISKAVPAGEKLKIVKEIRKVEGRLPANEYLTTIVKCLVEEAKLEGLTQELVVKVFNNNVAGDQNIAISWDKMIAPDPTRLPEVPLDEVEAKISAILDPPTTPWSPQEAAELDDPKDDDEPHLNGDGKSG